MSGGNVEFKFSAQTQAAADAIGKVGLSFDRVEGSARRLRDTAKSAGGALKEAGDAGARGFEAMGQKIAGVVGQATAAAAALEGVRRVLKGIDEDQRRAATESMRVGQSLAATLVQTGDTGRAASVEESLRRLVSGPGGIGGKLEGVLPAYTAFRRAGGDSTAAGLEQFAAMMRGADAAKVGNAPGFVDTTRRLMNNAPGMGVQGAMGRALLMQQAGVSDVGGYVERMGGDVDTATALAVMAGRAGQDIGIVEKVAARVRAAQDAGPQFDTVAGRKVARASNSILFDASGAPVPLGDILRRGFGGEIAGFDQFFEGKTAQSARAIIGRGNMASAMNAVRNASGIVAGIEGDLGRAGGLVGAARDFEAVEGFQARGQQALLSRAGGNQVELDRQMRLAAYEGSSLGGLGRFIEDFLPTGLGSRIERGIGLGEGLAAWGATLDPNYRDPSVNVSSPAGMQVDVRIRRDPGRATPDAP